MLSWLIGFMVLVYWLFNCYFVVNIRSDYVDDVYYFVKILDFLVWCGNCFRS